ncbi:MAG: hypothetical protein WCY41_04265 [Candidatus Micrarchaeia archaeon]
MESQESEERTEPDARTPKKIAGQLIPFKANDARSRELARLGGSVRSPEKRIQAMLSRARRRNAVAYAKYADISPKAALALMRVFLDEGRYRDFLREEMFELLGAVQGDYHKVMERSRLTDCNGVVWVDHNSEERKEAIRTKMKVIELLLKAGRAFFPEMRETGVVQAVQVNIKKD